jgi:hypothetical protein
MRTRLLRKACRVRNRTYQTDSYCRVILKVFSHRREINQTFNTILLQEFRGSNSRQLKDLRGTDDTGANDDFSLCLDNVLLALCFKLNAGCCEPGRVALRIENDLGYQCVGAHREVWSVSVGCVESRR